MKMKNDPSLAESTLELTDFGSSKFAQPNLGREELFAENLIGLTTDQYTIESLLGRGGMAWVFLARHSSLHRPCAIKVLCPELFGRKADSLELFLAEARTAAALVHPNIVSVHNIGKINEHYFIEMEYVPGSTLDQLITSTSPLSSIDATWYILQASSALASAHNSGFVHGDIKPANILVRPDGTVKLADFGLAKNFEIQAEQSKPGDGGGRLMGTPQFMAPELFRGEPANQQSDIYAIGISFYYALTGRHPFTESSLLALAKAHAEQPIPDPRMVRHDIPLDAVTFIERCLAKKPADRFSCCDGLVRELRQVFGGMRDLPGLVVDVLSSLDSKVERMTDRVVATICLEIGRKQTVYLEFCPPTSMEQRLIRIFSVCAPVDETYLRQALEFNATMSHGAIAIQEVDGIPHFVMLNTYLQATCEAEDIRRSVLEVAHWADGVEQRLTSYDTR